MRRDRACVAKDSLKIRCHHYWVSSLTAPEPDLDVDETPMTSCDLTAIVAKWEMPKCRTIHSIIHFLQHPGTSHRCVAGPKANNSLILCYGCGRMAGLPLVLLSSRGRKLENPERKPSWHTRRTRKLLTERPHRTQGLLPAGRRCEPLHKSSHTPAYYTLEHMFLF